MVPLTLAFVADTEFSGGDVLAASSVNGYKAEK